MYHLFDPLFILLDTKSNPDLLILNISSEQEITFSNSFKHFNQNRHESFDKPRLKVVLTGDAVQHFKWKFEI